jgi:hypothetical protein
MLSIFLHNFKYIFTSCIVPDEPLTTTTLLRVTNLNFKTPALPKKDRQRKFETNLIGSDSKVRVKSFHLTAGR